VVVLCAFVTSPLFSRGRQEEGTLEERLSAEAALIAQEYSLDPEDYAGWVIELTRQVVEDDEQFDAVQRELDIILDRYREYQNLGEEALALLNQLFDREISATLDQDEVTALRVEVLATLEQMRTLIPFPSEAEERILDDLTFLLQLALDTARKDALMDQALVLLHPEGVRQPDRSGAVSIYTNEENSVADQNDAAMMLQIDYYDPDRYGPVVASIVQSVKSAMTDSAAALAGDGDAPGLEVSTLAAAQGVLSVFGEEGAESLSPLGEEERQSRFDQFLTQFVQATAVRRSVVEAADVLDAQIELVAPNWPDTGNGRNDFHLLFLQEYLRGRDSVEEPEGIVYAIESLVNEVFQSVSIPAELQGRSSYDEAVMGLDAAEIPVAELNQETRVAAAGRADQVLALVVDGIVVQSGNEATELESPSDYAGLLDEADAQAVLALLARMRSAEQLPSVLSSFQDAVVEYDRGGTRASTLRLRREGVQEGVDTIGEQAEEWRAQTELFTETGEVGSSIDTRGVLENHANIIAARTAQLREYEIDLVDRIATLELEELNQTYRGRSAVAVGGLLQQVADAEADLEGSVDEGRLKRRPDEAEARLTVAQRGLQTLSSDLAEFQTRYGPEEERQYVASTARIQGHVESAHTLQNDVDSTLSHVATLLSQARQLQRQAVSLGNTADADYDEAIRQVDIANSGGPPREVEDAVNAAVAAQGQFANNYNASLANWWRDSEARRWQLREEELQGLIAEARRLLVTTRVQQDLDDAREYYELARYEEAINLLTDARDEWMQVFEQPNALVELWLSRARNAATLRENIEIDLNEPDAQQNQLLLERALQLEEDAAATINMQERIELVGDARELLNALFEDQPRNLKGRTAQIRLSLLVAEDPSDEIDRQVNDLQESFAELDDPLAETQREDALRYLTQAEAIQEVIEDQTEVAITSRFAVNNLVDDLQLLLNPPAPTNDREINAILAFAYARLPSPLPRPLPPLRQDVYDTVRTRLESGLNYSGERIDELTDLYQLVVAAGPLQEDPWRARALASFNEARVAYQAGNIVTAVRIMEDVWEDTRVRAIEEIGDFYEDLLARHPDLFR
jgi:hypothetical protein